VILWDLETGEEIRRFIGHNSPVLSVAFSADGNAFQSVSADGLIILWRIDNLEALMNWTRRNRYWRDLTCNERQQFALVCS
jgi:WD40 repeat protein